MADSRGLGLNRAHHNTLDSPVPMSYMYYILQMGL